ncbi:MAG: hypothetical protein Q8Q23_04920 [bacterium]|nr:hypothetical protein [bacterium]
MRNFFQKINRHKKVIFVSVFLFFVIFIVTDFVIVDVVNAQGYSGSIEGIEAAAKAGAKAANDEGLSFADYLNPLNWVPLALGWFLQIIVKLLGGLLTVFIDILVEISQYNNFIKEAPVEIGWVVVRDIANMFFVLILLVIAFATILRIPSYEMNRTLPKLIIMAVLINFSKTICGLIIDAAQVIMLFFVNGFYQIGKGNLVSILGVESFLSIEQVTEKDWVQLLDVASGFILGAIFLAISLVAVATLAIVLIYRMVMLWIYVILSPLAYLMSAFPSGQKYASQWWSGFTSTVIIGPVLAFFIWLSFSTLDKVDGANFFTDPEHKRSVQQTAPNSTIGAKLGATVVEAGSSENIMKFIIVIGMLMGGLIISQQIGGAAGGVAGKAIGSIQKGRGLAWRGTKGTGKFAWQKVGRPVATVAAGAGTALYGASLGRATNATKSWLRQGTDAGLGLIGLSQKQIIERKDIRDRRLEARQTGVYKDATGKEYKEIKDKYYYDNKEQKWATDSSGNRIKTMGGTQAALIAGWARGTMNAKGVSNRANQERIEKEQKKISDAGTSNAQLRQVLISSSASQTKKLAAAMTLAVKEGFTDASQVAEAKRLIGKDSVLLKQFDDTIDKKFAHLNYDVSTEKGKQEFRSRIDDGAIDGGNMHHSAYSNEYVLRALKEHYKNGFASKMETASKRDSRTSESMQQGALAARNVDLDAGGKLYDSGTGEINPFAKLVARLQGDVTAAFNNSTKSGAFNFDNTSKEAATKFFETAKGAWLDNFKIDNLKISKVQKDFGLATAAEAETAVKAVEQAIADGIDGSKLASMQRTGYSPEFIARSIGSIEKHAPSKYSSQIAGNNTLANIKKIDPEST